MYLERGLVFRASCFVDRSHAVFGPEVQMSSSVPQCFNKLHRILQLGREGEWRLYSTHTGATVGKTAICIFR